MKRKNVTTLMITFALAAVFVSGPLIMITNANADKEDDSADGVYANSAEVIASQGFDEVLHVDWTAVGDQIAAGIQGAGNRIVDVLTGDVFEVPAEVLNFISGSDVSLALQARAGLAFSIAGRDVDKREEPLKLAVSSQGFPEAAKQLVMSGAVAYCEFELQGYDMLPFTMNAHMIFGPQYAGNVAILYYIDEAAGMLKFMGTFRMNEFGQAMFGLTRGGSYMAVVMDQADYTVLDGDTLSHIAGKYGTTVESLTAANPEIADVNMIVPGQVIKLY